MSASTIASDRTISIRASLREVEMTLLIALALVVLVVSAFLTSVRATLVPAVAVVVSLLGTLGVMYLAGYSLNNLSLMALTVATGFVVDDAIVVLENVSRHLEAGMGRFRGGAARRARSRLHRAVDQRFAGRGVHSAHLHGRHRRAAVPRVRDHVVGGGDDLAGRVAHRHADDVRVLAEAGAFDAHPIRAIGALDARRRSSACRRRYARSLDWSLAHAPMMILLLVGIVALNVYLFVIVPKGFFPQQDLGQLNGGMRADQSISFQAMQGKLQQLVDIIRKDPAVQTVVGFTGGQRAGGGFMFATLKPRVERKDDSQTVIARLRSPACARDRVSPLPQSGARRASRRTRGELDLSVHDCRATICDGLRRWATRLAERMKQDPVLTDVDTDQQDHGVESYLTIDRPTATRFGITSRDIDNALYDAFGQRQVSTIYTSLNQYHVIDGSRAAAMRSRLRR